ncbi:lamin tail domain-containing protein [Planctomycetota bacterium]
MQHATRNTQHATRNTQHATRRRNCTLRVESLEERRLLTAFSLFDYVPVGLGQGTGDLSAPEAIAVAERMIHGKDLVSIGSTPDDIREYNGGVVVPGSYIIDVDEPEIIRSGRDLETTAPLESISYDTSANGDDVEDASALVKNTEWSGVAYKEEADGNNTRATIYVVSDEPFSLANPLRNDQVEADVFRINEYNLNGYLLRHVDLFGFKGALPGFETNVPSIQETVVDGVEGLVWKGGDDFAIVMEGSNAIVEFSMDVTTTAIDYGLGVASGDVNAVYISPSPELDGNNQFTGGQNDGLEGVSYDATANLYFVAKEIGPQQGLWVVDPTINALGTNGLLANPTWGSDPNGTGVLSGTDDVRNTWKLDVAEFTNATTNQNQTNPAVYEGSEILFSDFSDTFFRRDPDDSDTGMLFAISEKGKEDILRIDIDMPNNLPATNRSSQLATFAGTTQRVSQLVTRTGSNESASELIVDSVMVNGTPAFDRWRKTDGVNFNTVMVSDNENILQKGIEAFAFSANGEHMFLLADDDQDPDKPSDTPGKLDYSRNEFAIFNDLMSVSVPTSTDVLSSGNDLVDFRRFVQQPFNFVRHADNGPRNQDLTVGATVQVVELMYNDATAEYVVLRNATDAAIILDGYSIDDDNTGDPFEFAANQNLSLAAKEFLVISPLSAASFATTFGTLPSGFNYLQSNLPGVPNDGLPTFGNNDDEVRLYDATSTLISHVEYDDGDGADGNGKALGIVNDKPRGEVDPLSAAVFGYDRLVVDDDEVVNAVDFHTYLANWYDPTLAPITLNSNKMDTDNDGDIDDDDRDLVLDALFSRIADFDFDGIALETNDLVLLFQAGTYETGTTVHFWYEGDLDNDGVFGSGDLVVAFADGGVEHIRVHL